MVPVDSFVCSLVQRLRFFRSFDPLPADHRLLARPRSKQTLIRTLRAYLHEVSAAAGIPARIVPHQLRHYAGSRTIPGELKLGLIGGSVASIFPA
jgi:integrase